MCGCGPSNSNDAGASNANAKKPRKITVALDWSPEPDYLGIYYAKELGLFEKVGAEVEILEGRGSNLSAASVAAEKYPLAFCSGGATVLSFNSTSNLISLAVLYPKVPTVAFGMASEQVKTIFDLRGKRVGIYPGSINNNEWAAFLLANNLDPKEFATVIAISGPDLPLIKAKQVDAVLNYAPMSPTALELDPSLPEVNGKRTFEFPLADYGVKAYGLNLVTSKQSLKVDGELLRRVVSAICDGYRLGCANPDAAVNAFCKVFPEKDPAYVKRGWAKVCAMVSSQASVGQQTDRGWRETIETYQKLGLLQKELQPKDLLP